MERVRHTNVVVGLLADLWGDHKTLDTGKVALVGQRDQMEHELQVLIEVLRGRAGGLRQLQSRKLAVFGILHPPLDLPDALQVVAKRTSVLRPEAAVERGNLPGQHVQQARGLPREELALGGRIALAEKAHEELAGIALYRQGS